MKTYDNFILKFNFFSKIKAKILAGSLFYKFSQIDLLLKFKTPFNFTKIYFLYTYINNPSLSPLFKCPS